MKKLLVVILLLCSAAFAQAATYTKVIVYARRQNDTEVVKVRIERNGAVFYAGEEHIYIRNTAGGETLVQFRARVVAAEKTALDAAIDLAKAQDATEGTNTDDSANLNAITQ